jgi:hypothetical protein
MSSIPLFYYFLFYYYLSIYRHVWQWCRGLEWKNLSQGTVSFENLGGNSGLGNRNTIRKIPTWWENSVLGNRKTVGKILIWWEKFHSVGEKTSSVAWII